MHNIRILDVSYLYAIIYINAFMTGRNMHCKSPVPRLIQICSVNFIMKTFRRLFFDLVYHEFKLQLNPSSFFSQCVTLRYLSSRYTIAIIVLCFCQCYMTTPPTLRRGRQGLGFHKSLFFYIRGNKLFMCLLTISECFPYLDPTLMWTL